MDLAFGLLPSVTSRLPAPGLWVVTWCVTLGVGGVGVQAAMLHTLYDSLTALCCVQRRKSRLLLLVVLVLLLFLPALSTVTQVSVRGCGGRERGVGSVGGGGWGEGGEEVEEGRGRCR